MIISAFQEGLLTEDSVEENEDSVESNECKEKIINSKPDLTEVNFNEHSNIETYYLSSQWYKYIMMHSKYLQTI